MLDLSKVRHDEVLRVRSLLDVVDVATDLYRTPSMKMEDNRHALVAARKRLMRLEQIDWLGMECRFDQKLWLFSHCSFPLFSCRRHWKRYCTQPFPDFSHIDTIQFNSRNVQKESLLVLLKIIQNLQQWIEHDRTCFAILAASLKHFVSLGFQNVLRSNKSRLLHGSSSTHPET